MNQTIQTYIQTANTYTTEHKKQFTIGGVIAVVVIIIIFIVALVQFNTPKAPTIVYRPVTACGLLTPTKAQELLGEKVVSPDSVKNPIVSGDTASSNCSYTDANPNADVLLVAAVAVRSGINDQGDKQNKTEFDAKKPSDAEAVSGVGDTAWFDKTTGQLNILRKHDWIILSYGVGNDPQSNTVDKAVELAHKILN